MIFKKIDSMEDVGVICHYSKLLAHVVKNLY